MKQISNPWRRRGLDIKAPLPIATAEAVARLLALCPVHSPTPLVSVPSLAHACGVSELWIKDERGRMGLGSFKALGAAFVIARDAATRRECGDWANALSNCTYVTASAGNHGLSVAAGAAIFGARACIYLSDTVPESFAERLRDKGAQVIREGHNYEASMQAAVRAAKANGWTLLSDSSWAGYMDIPRGVMEGYVQMATEAAEQAPTAPTHILLQAGVGGLAGAVAAYARAHWGHALEIIVVEPNAAPALFESIKSGHAIETAGPVSNMGRLDCKTPSLIALAGLSKDADAFVTLTDTEAQQATQTLAKHGLTTTPSGGAGLAALLCGLDLGLKARVLSFLTEGPDDG